MTQVAQMFSIYAVETEELIEADYLEQWTPWTAYSNMIKTSPEVQNPDSLHILLVEFPDLFVEPKTLPS